MALETEEKFVMDINFFNDHLKERCKSSSTLRQAYITPDCQWETLIGLDEHEESFVSLKSTTAPQSIKFPLSQDCYNELISARGVQSVGKPENSYKVDPLVWALRIRTVDDESAVFCFKERVAGSSRLEYEADIPLAAATLVYGELTHRIHKVRHLLENEGYTWEIDIFLDENHGLCVAEIETEDKEFPLIDGLVRRVTEDQRYYNAELCAKPYQSWETF